MVPLQPHEAALRCSIGGWRWVLPKKWCNLPPLNGKTLWRFLTITLWQNFISAAPNQQQVSQRKSCSVQKLLCVEAPVCK